MTNNEDNKIRFIRIDFNKSQYSLLLLLGERSTKKVIKINEINEAKNPW